MDALQATGDRPSYGDLKVCPVPDFICDGVGFFRVIVDDGHRYEWISETHRLRCGRNEGKATCWASHKDRVVGTNFINLKAAMRAAIDADQRAVA